MRLVRFVCMLAAVGTAARSLAAQRAPDTRAPVPDSANAIPAYPDWARENRIGGVVRVTFVVDSTGRPDMRSYRVRESTANLLNSSVKGAVGKWQFQPARRGGRPVADSVEHVIEFVPPTTVAAWMPPSQALVREAIGPGRWRLVVGGPTQVMVERPAAESLHMAVATAALDTLLAMLPPSPAYPPRIACIALGMTSQLAQPPLELQRALSRTTYTVVASGRCPKTFGSMMRVVYADGRAAEPDPPDEDPWAFTPRSPRAVYDSIVLIDIDMSHATMSGTYNCYAERDSSRARGWRAVCRQGRMSVH